VPVAAYLSLRTSLRARSALGLGGRNQGGAPAPLETLSARLTASLRTSRLTAQCDAGRLFRSEYSDFL
jgi:hypothetical protein